MEAGKFSKIVSAIAHAEKNTTGEIRVHISKRWIDRHPLTRAEKLFSKYGMTQTQARNGVLLYVNIRKRRFAIVGDEGIHRQVGQKYWEDLAQKLRDDLKTTDQEKAIAQAVHSIGETLKRFFPANPSNSNPDELSNEVGTD